MATLLAVLAGLGAWFVLAAVLGCLLGHLAWHDRDDPPIPQPPGDAH